MHERVYGLETEYAVLFVPVEGSARPSPRETYDHISTLVQERYKTIPARNRVGLFLENGGLLHLEGDPGGGLVEISTPECRSAREAVIYQRAMDDLLIGLQPELDKRLLADGYAGHVVFGKNSTDNKGNFYGTHENYYVADRAVLPRPVLWLAAAIYSLMAAPFVVLTRVLPLLVLAATTGWARLVHATLVVLCLVPGLERRIRPVLAGWPREMSRRGEAAVSGALRLCSALMAPLARAWTACLARVVFRPVQQALLPYFLTRPVWCGSGRLKVPPSRGRSPFLLMQKSEVLGALVGLTLPGRPRPLIDLKALVQHPFGVLAPKRRLQIAYSDSNMAERATWLKLAVTGLLLQMIEDGHPFPPLALQHPLDAARQVSEDWRLSAGLALTNGEQWTALQIQRFYLGEARTYVATHGDKTSRAVVEAWDDLLRRLEANSRTQPAWDVDWCAKRHLMLEALGGMCSLEDLPMVRGWATELESAGLTLEGLSRMGDRDIDETLRRALTARSYVTLNHYLHARQLSWLDFLTMSRLTWAAEKIDLKYHQLGPQGYAAQLATTGLSARIGSDDEVRDARTLPPTRTRAQIRGYLVRRYQNHARSASMDWGTFEDSQSHVKVELRDPLESNPTTLSLP